MNTNSIMAMAAGILTGFPRLALAGSASAASPSAGAPPAAGGPAGMSDIHDIKPAIAMYAHLPVWVWFVAAGVLAAAAAVWWIMRRRKRSSAEPIEVTLLPPDVQALNDLDALAADTGLEGKPFYFRLSAILRMYLEGRYGVAAAEMTTEELLPAVDRLDWPAELYRTLAAFCRASDPVKFAEQPARAETMAADLAFVRRMVEATREIEDGTDDDHGSGQPASIYAVPAQVEDAGETPQQPPALDSGK